MDDLRVENYEAKEVSRKEQKILKRVAFTGSVIGVVLSLFGLAVLGRSTAPSRDRPPHQVEIGVMNRLPGGGGAWFFSWVDWRDWP